MNGIQQKLKVVFSVQLHSDNLQIWLFHVFNVSTHYVNNDV